MNPNEITPQATTAPEDVPSIADMAAKSDITAAPTVGDQSAVTPMDPIAVPLITTATTVAAGSPLAADDTTTGYTPTFSDATRTVVYVACAVIGLFGLLAAIASVATGAPAWLTIASSLLGFAAPYIANMFGVAYNPLKMSAKTNL